VDWLADQFQSEHGIDLRRDRQALQRLTEAAEKAKIELSGVQSTPISLPFIATGEAGPLHIETTLERRTFEGLCPDLLDRLLRPVQRALRDSGLAAEDIDDRQRTELVAIAELVMDEVEAPDLVRALRLEPLLPMNNHFTPTRTPAPQDKAFLAIEAVDQVLADRPAFPAQHNLDTSVAVTDTCLNDLPHAQAGPP
jgi:hypothetical protein